MGRENVLQNVLIIFESSGRSESYRVNDSPQSPSYGSIGDSILLIRKLSKNNYFENIWFIGYLLCITMTFTSENTHALSDSLILELDKYISYLEDTSER